MGRGILLSVGIAITFLVGSSPCAAQTDFTLPSQPSSGMTVDSGGGVFLAAGSQLFRLDRNLAFQENVTLGSDILKIALSNDESRLVVCLSDESCAVYSATDFSAGPQLTIGEAAASSDDVALFTTPGDTFYVGSYGSLPATTNILFLTQHGFGNASFTRSTRESDNSFISQTNQFARTFYRGFVQDVNAYYFVIDTSPTDVRGLRVLRVCNIAECAGGSSVCEVDALYEAELECSGLGVVMSGICGVSLLENIAGSAVKTIILSVCGDRNRICSFGLTEIDTAMDNKYTECSGGTGSNELVWGGPTRSCAGSNFQDNANGVCDFNPALATTDSVSGPNRVSISGFGMDTITASLAITVEDTTSLLYVGTTTTSGNHFLAMYHLTSDCTTNSCTDEEFNTIPMDSAVRQLQWQDGLDYIYVATDTLVTQVPLEECSTYTDCDSCINHRNPLCGWCTVEEKCSRRSQCQNATGTMRWEQNITECITIIDVSPNQFVLNDQDDNVTVTVSSPGLPPLLDGESYLCHFRESGGGGIEFTTEATEVTNNAVYTCDLNGTIPAFSGGKLATDVSFISSLVDVPFGTEDNALTFYNCPTATSCSQCVETENACGWCIYNKLCSGTADTCTNSSDAYWYRLNGTNSSSEVCPFLEPADINLDGDYVQPVMVDRDLVLNTTNLPQPISGFRYVCSLGSTELETVYVSENSLTCQVNENDIMFSSGVSGEERVSLSVLWVSDDGSSPPHPIDTRNGNQINVDLYSCMDLGTSCSLCLAANTGTGFDCGWCTNENSCDIQDLCSSATSSEQCPVPIITSFSPSSGPPTGGTIITISGTDLGVTYSDVANRVFFDGDPSVCETLEDRYVPGEQIVCVTQDFGNITSKQVPVTVILEGPRVSTTSQFFIETPAITGVDPEFGPVSGGTAVVVSGDSLRVGNIENTNITVNGIECAIQDFLNVNATQIMCSSMAFDGNTSQCDAGPQECLEDLSSCSLRSVSSAVGPVVINIDGSPFSGSGVDFEFRCDPRILCTSPQNTIPSGGVRLTFSGCGMDVRQRPLFVVTDNTSMPYPVETECVVTSDTSIECLMPRLDGSVSFGETLSYEIRIDGVTGPDFSKGDLQVAITVERDPEFPEGALVTTNFADIIEIKGMNLDSVDQSEINVTIGGVECEIRGTITAEEIFCDPPTQAPGGITEAPVVIFVGQNLNFSVGTLSYVGSDIVVTADSGGVTVSADIIVLAVVLPVVALLALSVVVVLVGYYCYKTKAYQTYPVKQRANEEDVIQLQSVEVPLSPTEVLMKTLPQGSLVSSSQLRLMDAIGQGEFGVVYRARLVKGPMPQLVAVKTLKGLFTPNDIQSMIDEILKMQAFDHPHVMSLLGVCMDAGPGISIIMPYMANGSLLKYLKNERSELVLLEDGADPDKVHPVRKLLLRMCCQIAQGMDYLTQQMFVHRDLAARNCMLDSSGNIKVADFGLGEDVYTTGYFRQSKDDPIKLPFKWMSPESLEDGVFSEKSDVWSFGVTCWEVFTAGKVPYPAVDSYALPKLLEGGMRLEKPPNAACSIDIYAVMLQCWYASPERRPSFNDLATSLSQMLESIADYMEICMNLPKPEELPADYPYEVIDTDPAPVQSLSEEREVAVPVTPPEVHEYEIPVQPNPVYGAAGDDIPMEKNPVYGVSSTSHAL